jgi:protein tyrosine/serine phosphatase
MGTIMQAEAQQIETPPPHRLPPLWRRRLVSGVALTSLFLLGYQIYYVILGRNLHEVSPGQIYRSAQLSPSDLRGIVEKNKIRTVINLRGCCPEMGWYQDERATLHELGVTEYDITFSSYVWPGVAELQQLVEVLKTCAYPILIHCRRGADRTGMASAAAMLLKTDSSLRQARRQLSWRYGHVSFSRTNVHDQVFDLYHTWLRQSHRQHKPELFYQWIMEDYRPGHCWAEIEPLEVPQELVLGRPAAARYRVHNRGLLPWHFRQSANTGVHLHFVMGQLDGKAFEAGAAGYFDADVAPGDSIDLTICLPPLRVRGRYQLMVDMGDEQCCWFSLVGSMPLSMELDVVDAHSK